MRLLGRLDDAIEPYTAASTLAKLIDDNKKIILGTGTDLEVFHNGSNSIINDAGTGNLQLQVGGSTKVDIGASAITFNSTVTGPTTDTLLIKNSAGTTLKTIRGV